MSSFLEVAVEAAREAGAILLAEFDRPQKIGYKGEVDIVTEADRRSEQAVVARLRTYFPKHEIVAEEGGGSGTAGAQGTGPRFCWWRPSTLRCWSHSTSSWRSEKRASRK